VLGRRDLLEGNIKVPLRPVHAPRNENDQNESDNKGDTNNADNSNDLG